MPALIECDAVEERLESYLNRTLGKSESEQIDRHLRSCDTCREAVKCSRAVHGLLEYVEIERKGEAEPVLAGVGIMDRFSAAPWWAVSALLHVLVIALAGLISIGISLPEAESYTAIVTDLTPRKELNLKPDKPAADSKTALMGKYDVPATQDGAPGADILVPPDFLEKCILTDHWETKNLDRPDTHDAYGNENSHIFYLKHGDASDAGGGGVGGTGLDDLVGVGGFCSPGSGGGFGGGNGTGTGLDNGSGHGSFGRPTGGGRLNCALRHGGSRAGVDTVDQALNWLAYHQEADGHWDCAKYGGGNHDVAMTGLALLAFLGSGHDEKVGSHKENVQRAVAWMKSKQQQDGSYHHNGYEQAIAAMAMAEAAGMANIKSTRDSAQKAINYCTEIHQQGEGSEKGAWRYAAKSQTADLSVSGWFVMAMKSAKMAGLSVNPASFQGALKYLDEVQQKVADADASYAATVTYGYRTPGCGPRTCAIGNLCRLFMGWDPKDVENSARYFVEKYGVPAADAGKTDLYYWYYASMCLFQQQGDVWKQWSKGMLSALVPTQCKEGDDAGSWNPAGDFSAKWGRVGQTALSCLTLEVYWRYKLLHPEAK